MAKKTQDLKLNKRALARDLFMQGEYTQEEIAQKIGTSRQTIARWAKEDKTQVIAVGDTY